MTRPLQITRFFDGLDLVAPGVVPFTQAARPGRGPSAEVDGYCGVGRKP